MKTAIALLTLLTLTAGCAPKFHTLSFDSAPPGARIFLGRGINEKSATSETYLGQAPCKWTVEVNGDGSFKMPGIPVYSSFVKPVYVFIARHEGAEIRQLVHGGAVFQTADFVPDALFFDFIHPTNTLAAPVK